uniref:Uncharacterized protein n=1 Tax=Anguilla anguilla TaxID=7936 RepID=A0A0E9RTV8_ANGAN
MTGEADQGSYLTFLTRPPCPINWIST